MNASKNNEVRSRWPRVYLTVTRDLARIEDQLITQLDETWGYYQPFSPPGRIPLSPGNEYAVSRLMDDLEREGILELDRDAYEFDREFITATDHNLDYVEAYRFRISDGARLSALMETSVKPIHEINDVRLKNYAVIQGAAIYQPASIAMRSLIRLLWEKRQEFDPADEVKKVGAKMSAVVIADTELKVSRRRLKSLQDQFNGTMRRKGITARITGGERLQMVVSKPK